MAPPPTRGGFMRRLSEGGTTLDAFSSSPRGRRGGMYGSGGIMSERRSSGSIAMPSSSTSLSFHQQPSSLVTTPTGVSFTPPQRHQQRPKPTSYLQQQSCAFESMSAPEDFLDTESLTGQIRGLRAASPASDLYPRVLVSDGEARDLCPPLFDLGSTASSTGGAAAAYDTPGGLTALSGRTKTGHRRKLDSTFRNDSLSSDQSECVPRPNPPKPHKRRGKTTGTTHIPTQHPALRSGLQGSSSEEEVRSTPDYTSCGEEMESESISEVGE